MTRLTLPHARDLPPDRLAARRAHLVAELRPQRRRRRLLVAVPALLLAVAATAWTAHRLTREVSHFESVGCYDRVSLDANVTVIDPQTTDPVAVCASLWRQGHVSTGTTNVPPLRPCVLESGAVAVFPAPDACAALGLAEPPPDYLARSRRLGELRAALRAVVPGRCPSAEQAAGAVRRELDARGLRDWRVERGSEPFGDERPCASLAIDGAAKTVTVVATPR